MYPIFEGVLIDTVFCQHSVVVCTSQIAVDYETSRAHDIATAYTLRKLCTLLLPCCVYASMLCRMCAVYTYRTNAPAILPLAASTRIQQTLMIYPPRDIRNLYNPMPTCHEWKGKLSWSLAKVWVETRNLDAVPRMNVEYGWIMNEPLSLSCLRRVH